MRFARILGAWVAFWGAASLKLGAETTAAVEWETVVARLDAEATDVQVICVMEVASEKGESVEIQIPYPVPEGRRGGDIIEESQFQVTLDNGEVLKLGRGSGPEKLEGLVVPEGVSLRWVRVWVPTEEERVRLLISYRQVHIGGKFLFLPILDFRKAPQDGASGRFQLFAYSMRRPLKIDGGFEGHLFGKEGVAYLEHLKWVSFR